MTPSGLQLRNSKASLFDHCSLSGVLGQFPQMFAVLFWRSDDLHFLPVVRKLSATIKACDIGSRQSGGLGTARCSAIGYWKAEAGMLAAKNCFNKFCEHVSTFHYAGWLARVFLV